MWVYLQQSSAVWFRTWKKESSKAVVMIRELQASGLNIYKTDSRKLKLPQADWIIPAYISSWNITKCRKSPCCSVQTTAWRRPQTAQLHVDPWKLPMNACSELLCSSFPERLSKAGCGTETGHEVWRKNRLLQSETINSHNPWNEASVYWGSPELLEGQTVDLKNTQASLIILKSSTKTLNPCLDSWDQ